MKITKSDLRRLIKEELSQALFQEMSGPHDGSNIEDIVKRMMAPFRGTIDGAEAQLLGSLKDWVSASAAEGLDLRQEPHKTLIEEQIRAEYSSKATSMIFRVMGSEAMAGDVRDAGPADPMYGDDEFFQG